MTPIQIQDLVFALCAVVFGIFVGTLINAAKVSNLRIDVDTQEASINDLKERVQKLQDRHM